MDMDGNIAHTWSSLYNPGNAVYMNEDASILRTGALKGVNAKYSVGGSGGIVERIEWNGDVSWSFAYANDQVLLHHDIEALPNGNILMIAWETLSEAEAIRLGRNPQLISDKELWPDHIIEVTPSNNEIVWEWHVIDHLIQDYDASKSNHGLIGDHAELADINYIGNEGNGGGADWMHTNAIDYNEALDQILLSVHGFNEIWIIDHSTTTEEAASHEGGKQNSGGDILYRWGNPQAYDQGDEKDQLFFGQHDAQWILTEDKEEAILVFNNGVGRGKGDNLYSSVDQIVIEREGNGEYKLNDEGKYLPEKLDWTYKADQASDFFSQNISGAQRLDNGHTLICNGSNGEFFEIDSSGEIVWTYTNEFSNTTQNKNQNSPVFRVTRYFLDLSSD